MQNVYIIIMQHSVLLNIITTPGWSTAGLSKITTKLDLESRLGMSFVVYEVYMTLFVWKHNRVEEWFPRLLPKEVTHALHPRADVSEFHLWIVVI